MDAEESLDPAIARGVARHIDHDPPFTAYEIETLPRLLVRNARDVSSLQKFTGLRRARLIGCGSVRLDPLVDLPDLSSLIVDTSDLSSVAEAPEIRRLLRLEVPNNFVTDISPLLDCRRLVSVDVSGNPLSAQSYEQVLPALRDKGVSVTASEERLWRITLRLHDIGLPFSYYRKDGMYLLCRPGLRYSDEPEYNHPMISPEDLEVMIDERPGEIEHLFEREDLMPKLFPSSDE